MKTHITAISLGLILSLGSCTSGQQLDGIFKGSMLGGVFGSAVGGMVDGPRGHDAGRALGMIIGGAAGAAATAPREPGAKTERRGNSRDSYDYTDEYNRRPSHAQPVMPAIYSGLTIENIRFIDANNNHAIDADERCKIVFDVRNTGRETVHRVAPVVAVRGSKQLVISPTAIIPSIAPGRAVRYSADIYGRRGLRTGHVMMTVGFAYGNYRMDVREFTLPTHGRRYRY